MDFIKLKELSEDMAEKMIDEDNALAIPTSPSLTGFGSFLTVDADANGDQKQQEWNFDMGPRSWS